MFISYLSVPVRELSLLFSRYIFLNGLFSGYLQSLFGIYSVRIENAGVRRPSGDDVQIQGIANPRAFRKVLQFFFLLHGGLKLIHSRTCNHVPKQLRYSWRPWKVLQIMIGLSVVYHFLGYSIIVDSKKHPKAQEISTGRDSLTWSSTDGAHLSIIMLIGYYLPCWMVWLPKFGGVQMNNYCQWEYLGHIASSRVHQLRLGSTYATAKSENPSTI